MPGYHSVDRGPTAWPVLPVRRVVFSSSLFDEHDVRMITRHLLFILLAVCAWPCSKGLAQDTALVGIKPFQTPIVSMCHDGQGNIWFNTASDLYTFDGDAIKWSKRLPQRKTLVYKNGKPQFYEGTWGSDGRLVNPPWEGNECWAAYLPQGNREIFAAPDKRGTIWVTGGQHLYGFHIERNFRHTLSGQRLQGITAYGNSLLTVSDSGLFIDGVLRERPLCSNGNPLAVSAKEVWLPCRSIQRYFPGRDSIAPPLQYPHPGKQYPFDYLCPSPEGVWAASESGLFRIVGDTVRRSSFTKAVEYLSTYEGYLYIAAKDGIYRGVGDTFERVTAFPPQHYHFIQRMGNTWWATSKRGIWRWEGASRRPARRMFPNEPLDDLESYGILQDRFGYLWVSTHAGIHRFKPDGGRYESYLTHIEFNKRSFAAIRDSFYFGSVNGLYAFPPLSFPTIAAAAFAPYPFLPNYVYGVGAISLLLLGIAGFFLLQWKKTQRQLYGTYQKNISNPSNNLLERLEHYIADHLTEVTVGSLSSFSGLPQRSLYRFLQDHHCVTPGDLIRTVRVRHAKKLMEAGASLSKEEIAEVTGLSVFQITRISR